jgi:hypothetical protein
VGKKGERWKSGQVILRYPIAEMFVYGGAGQVRWAESISHSVEVECVAVRPGLLPCYASASSKNAGQEFSQDPSNAVLMDQRDEPVYCGVIEIEDRTTAT